MKAIKVTLLFLILCFSATAKDSTKLEFKRFAMGIHASPDYCYRTLNNASKFRDENEFSIIGYTAGADFSIYLKQKIVISFGMNFSQKGYINKYGHTTSYGQVGQSYYTRYNYNYIEIPLKVNALMGKKKIRMIAGIGVNSSFLLYQQGIRIYENSKFREKQKRNLIYNPFNLFLSGSVGIDCKLGEKMGLRIEPTYSYGLFETINSYYSEKLWSAGLNIGCYIKL